MQLKSNLCVHSHLEIAQASIGLLEVSKAGLPLSYFPSPLLTRQVIAPTFFFCSSSVNNFCFRFLLFYLIAQDRLRVNSNLGKAIIQPQHCHKWAQLDQMIYTLFEGSLSKGFLLTLLTQLCSFMISINSLQFMQQKCIVMNYNADKF